MEDVEAYSHIDCLASAGTLAPGHNHPGSGNQAIARFWPSELPLHIDLTTDEEPVHSGPDWPAAALYQGRISSATGTSAVEAR